MLNRSKLFKIIIIGHFIGPFVNIALNSWLSQMTLTHYLEILFQRASLLELFILFPLAPLAGCLLITKKTYAHLTYVACLFATLCYNLISLSMSPENYGLITIISAFSINVLLMVFIGVPILRDLISDKTDDGELLPPPSGQLELDLNFKRTPEKTSDYIPSNKDDAPEKPL